MMKIENRKIGSAEQCFIIAEAGVNHNGDIGKALKMIAAAAEAGADAIKFQTFQTDLLAAKEAPKAGYQKHNTEVDENQFQMLKQLELPREAYTLIIAECVKQNIIFMSTPFDIPSVDLLDELGMEVFKIPSGEITNSPLIKHIAAKQKPIILSTGMATMAEIELAVKTITATSKNQLVLLQCTSNYPVEYADVNLRAMNLLAQIFNVPVGFSDHTLGIEIAMAAVALGACVIEKHFTLDKSFPGPDHKMSLSPVELKSMVTGIRNVEMALGDGTKGMLESERNTAEVARKSIHYKTDLTKGKILEENDVLMLRPGDGVSPAELDSFIGKRLLHDVFGGAKLQESDFQE